MLNNRLAVVTGASRGIGAAIARRLASESAVVICVARTTTPSSDGPEGSLNETVEAIRDAGGQAHAVTCDITRADARSAMAEHILTNFGAVDVLINNAAQAAYGRSFDHPERMQDLELLLEINLRAPFDLIRRFAPAMLSQRWGAVLNISTATALMPEPPFNAVDRDGGSLLYGTTKAALDRLTYGLAAEWDGTGVRVNALRPRAAVWTPGVAAYAGSAAREHPGWAEEPIEAMSEAALALISGEPMAVSGLITDSLSFIEMAEIEIHALDGGPFAHSAPLSDI